MHTHRLGDTCDDRLGDAKLCTGVHILGNRKGPPTRILARSLQNMCRNSQAQIPSKPRIPAHQRNSTPPNLMKRPYEASRACSLLSKILARNALTPCVKLATP